MWSLFLGLVGTHDFLTLIRLASLLCGCKCAALRLIQPPLFITFEEQYGLFVSAVYTLPP